jgi:hypothetical protein
MPKPALTNYQLTCLRRACRDGRHYMLQSEVAFKRLVDAGFVTADLVGCAAWIMHTPAGFTYLCRHPSTLGFKELTK